MVNNLNWLIDMKDESVGDRYAVHMITNSKKCKYMKNFGRGHVSLKY